jgi:pimeloyl-ACP methyl ester carboxylesterase
MKSTEKVEVGGATIEYDVYGAGATVLLLPGGGFGIGYFERLALLLAEAGFRALAINLRGVGASTGPLDGLTLHDFAADVAGVIAALGCAPVHVVGHAFGNRVARCLAADRPDLVCCVVLLAAGGLVAPDPEAWAALQRMYHPHISASERLEAMQTALVSPAADLYLLHQVEVWPAAGQVHLVAAQTTPLEEWWEAGNVPLLVIQGLDDRIAPPGNGWALRDRFRARVQVVDLPEAGHMPLLEQPHAVAEALFAFLLDHGQGR